MVNQHPVRGAPRTDSRERILRVAADLFRQRGYAATSINDIAQQLGMVKSALYHHFSSKEEILSEILQRGLDDLLGPLEAIVASDLSPVEKLRAAMVHQLRAVTQGIDAPVAAVAIREPGALSPEMRERFIARRDCVDKLYRRIIEEGIRAGVFRPVDPKLFTFAVLGMCNLARQWYSPHGPYTCEEIADTFFDYVVEGLRNPETRG